MLYSDGAADTCVTALACRRLRTRLFAGRCVLELPSAVGSDPRHFDLVAAQGGSRGLRQKLTGACCFCLCRGSTRGAAGRYQSDGAV